MTGSRPKRASAGAAYEQLISTSAILNVAYMESCDVMDCMERSHVPITEPILERLAGIERQSERILEFAQQINGQIASAACGGTGSRPWTGMTRLDLLRHYSEKTPKRFLQIDGFHPSTGALEDLEDPDDDEIISTLTHELMNSPFTVRVLIPLDADAVVASRQLRKAAELMETEPGMLRRFLPPTLPPDACRSSGSCGEADNARASRVDGDD